MAHYLFIYTIKACPRGYQHKFDWAHRVVQVRLLQLIE